MWKRHLKHFNVKEKTENQGTLEKIAFFWFPVKDIKISSFTKSKKFLETSWASIITTYLKKTLKHQALHFCDNLRTFLG